MLTINRLLEFAGLDMSKRIKIARHHDTTRNIDIHELYALHEFEIYQAYQEQNRFKDCDYLVSCLGLEKNQALFVGVYEVKGITEVEGFPKDINVSFKGKVKNGSKYKYDLHKLSGFEDFEKRLVINWQIIAQSWYQWIDTNEKEVVQLLPKGYVREFPGYYDINIVYRELQEIISDYNANSLWHKMLSSIAGIYLIVDTESGMQYVGSASGKEGILGRWRDYVNNGHGNNLKLKEILSEQPNRVHKFKFSILRTLPNTLTKTEVVEIEGKYKEKLGSRAYGLNSN